MSLDYKYLLLPSQSFVMLIEIIDESIAPIPVLCYVLRAFLEPREKTYFLKQCLQKKCGRRHRQ